MKKNAQDASGGRGHGPRTPHLKKAAGSRGRSPFAAGGIFALLLLMCCSGAAIAADVQVEVTVTVTNAAGINTNGTCTLTVISDTRTATNLVSSSPSTLFLGTNAMLPAKTNLYQHLRLYPFGAGPTRLTLFDVSTNSFKLRGQPNQTVSASVAGSWGTVVLTTNAITNFNDVVTPYTYYSLASLTNVSSGLVEFFQFATNSVGNGLRAFTNLIDRISHQVMSNKTIRTSTNYGGVIDGTFLTNIVCFHGSNGTLTAMTIQASTYSGFIASMTNGTLYSNALHWVRFTNALAIHGTVHQLSNGLYIGPTLTNPVTLHLVNYGNAIQSDGTGANSFQIGSNAQATGLRSLAGGNSAFSSGEDGMAWGNYSTNTATSGTAVGQLTLVTGEFGTALGYGANATNYGTAAGAGASAGEQGSAFGRDAIAGEFAAAFGDSAEATAYGAVAIRGAASAINAMSIGGTASHSNSAAIGPADHTGATPETTTTNQIQLGTPAHVVSMPGFYQGTASNLVTAPNNTNVIKGDLSTPRSANTSIANGANTVNMGTNIVVDLAGSPSAAGWSVDGIKLGVVDPRDGQRLWLRNGTGYDGHFVHNSGLEPTAAYRISTATQTNIVFTNRACAELIYFASAARWILWTVFDGYQLTATATNAVNWLDGQATNLIARATIGGTNLTVPALTGSAQPTFQVVRTNGGLAFGVDSNGVTQVLAAHWLTHTQLVPTNNAASNITVNFNITNTVEIWFTNNLTFTNWSGVTDAGRVDLLFLLRPQLIPRGVNWGNLGLSNPGYGVCIATNAGNTLWTSLTNGKTYALSITRVRTNLFPILTLWE